jgi:hypothetical protein
VSLQCDESLCIAALFILLPTFHLFEPRQVPLDDFGPWEASGFAPEAEFLEKLKAIDGVSQVETQTITNMEI